MLLLLFIPLFCVAQHSKENAATLNSSPADSMVIIYSANLNGNIDNCRCGDPPLGGLDHFSTLLSREREKHFTLFFDGGDAFNAYSYPELNKALVSIYGLLQPDVFTVADQEFSEGRPFLSKALSRFGSAVVQGNTRIKAYAGADSYKRFKHKGRVVGVTSYLEMKNRQMGPVKDFLEPEKQRFDKAVKAISGTDYKVLIYHGERKYLPGLLKKYPSWDVVLLAHEQLAVNEMYGHIRLVCPGADGEYVSRIVLKKEAGKTRITVRQLPVGLELPADPTIKEIIKNYQH